MLANHRPLKLGIMAALPLIFGCQINDLNTPVNALVAAVSMTPNLDTMTVGAEVLFQAVAKTASGSAVSVPIDYTTLDTTVAKVASNGFVTGVAPGTTEIIASAKGVADTSEVTVIPPSFAPPALPQVFLNTDYVAPTGGRTIPVNSGDNLQAVLDSSKSGDILMLQPGAVFKGNFILRKKTGTAVIVIRSAAADNLLPAEHTRMNPTFAAQMPVIETLNFSPTLATENGASNYRLMFLNITADPTVTDQGAMVNLGDASGGQTDLSQVPTNIVVDRSWVHGHSTLQLRRCIGLHSAASAIIDSYLSDCHSQGFDTQAIWGGNGPGPFKIVDNFLEGSGENVMFGGGDPTIPNLVPSDIEIRRNYFFKPLSWMGGVWTAKNLMEIKNAQRVLVEGNVFENSWLDAQTGFAINLKSQNQSGGCPWCVGQDLTIRYNQIINCAGGIVFSGQDNGTVLLQMLRNVLVQNNTFYKIGGPTLDPSNDNSRLFLMVEAVSNITIDHNTGFAPKALLVMDVNTKAGFRMTNNLVGTGLYGVQGSGVGQGTAALEGYTPGYVFLDNALIGVLNAPYPETTMFFDTPEGAGIVDAAAGDYRLSSTSPVKGMATDGNDVGADVAAVAAATDGVRVQ